MKYEEFYSVEVMPMDKNGNLADGVCRSLYLHKSKFQRLIKYIDKLQAESINEGKFKGEFGNEVSP